MGRLGLAVAVAVVLVALGACAPAEPCPAGADCRWVLDTAHASVWVGADPFPALLLRLAPSPSFEVHLQLVWDRCSTLGCSWVPRSGPRPESAAVGANGVLALARAPTAPDGTFELSRALADGTRLRLAVETARLGQLQLPTAHDLQRCASDLGTRLAATTPEGNGRVHDFEIELACRIWLHPEQGRSVMLWHPVLHRVARQHACDMAERDYFGHVSPDGIGANLRLAVAGYALPAWYDHDVEGNNVESLALRAPSSTPRLTLEQWLASPMHRRHVLGESEFRAHQFDTATGYCSTVRDGVRMHYWAFLSARPGD